MKKILFFILTLVFVACSSGDGDNSIDSPNINPDIVGTWFATTLDSDDGTNLEATLVLNSDGTGSLTLVSLVDGEPTLAETLPITSWYTDDTTFYGTLNGNPDEFGYA
ncbi:hypothetical protein OAH77_06535, partial [Flavobacteriaceae bacterium]|nr:hypothetical protein [Flavobacteriaceae bacterium]